MTSATMTDLGLERLVRLDQRIDAGDTTARDAFIDATRARWEFGHAMLAAREGAKRLPNGYLAALADRTGKSQAELKFRAQFAEKYPTDDELANALASYSSWFAVTQSLGRSRVDEVTDAVETGDAPTEPVALLPGAHHVDELTGLQVTEDGMHVVTECGLDDGFRPWLRLATERVHPSYLTNLTAEQARIAHTELSRAFARALKVIEKEHPELKEGK